MFLKAEFFARCGRIALLTSVVTLATALLAACAIPAGLKSPPEAAPKAVATPAETPDSSAMPAPVSPSASSASTAPAPASEPVLRVLAYADRVRTMSAAELGQEVTRLNHAVAPAEQLQLALVLSQLRQTPELIRAQELLTRLLANIDTEAQALHPLARLLAARYGEQRRLEDLLEKQNQQTREVQRRLDQTHERLEALKAIERSLTSRPHTPAASAPASRARPPAP
jgi:hypothetical protein